MGLFNRSQSVGDKLRKNQFQEAELLSFVPLLKMGDAQYLSKQRRATQEVLISAAEVVDESELHYLLSHPRFPTRGLTRHGEIAYNLLYTNDLDLSRTRYESVSRNVTAILRHPNCSPETLDRFFSGSGSWLSKPRDTVILFNPNISNEIFETVIALDDLDLLLALAQNQSLDGSKLQRLIDLPYSLLHEKLKAHPRISEDTLAQISTETEASAETLLQKVTEASSLTTSAENLHALSRDVNFSVRLAVAGNRNLPAESVESLIESTKLSKYPINEESLEILIVLCEAHVLNSHQARMIWKKFYEAGFDYGSYPYELRGSNLLERAESAYVIADIHKDEEEEFND